MSEASPKLFGCLMFSAPGYSRSSDGMPLSLLAESSSLDVDEDCDMTRRWRLDYMSVEVSSGLLITSLRYVSFFYLLYSAERMFADLVYIVSLYFCISDLFGWFSFLTRTPMLLKLVFMICLVCAYMAFSRLRLLRGA